MERGGCIYILTNFTHNVLYIGVTSDLYSRIIEREEKLYAISFSKNLNATNWFIMNSLAISKKL